MTDTIASLALSAGVTLAWFLIAGAVVLLILYVALVAIPGARSRRSRRRNHWRDGMSVEALQRLQRMLWEEDEMERRKR